MTQHRGRQKKLAKQKKKRDGARQRLDSSALPTSRASLVRLAATRPFGPCFLSPGWRSDDVALPELVSVILTRRLPGGLLLPVIALVDRTCLGVKDGFAAGATDAAGLAQYLDAVGQSHGGTMEPCEPLVAQSVVLHAIDYARSLGFEPHADFPLSLVGPRPETLVDTPLARPAKPRYVPGPDDDVARVLAQLERVVAPEERDFVVAPRGTVRRVGGVARPAPATAVEEEDAVGEEEEEEGALADGHRDDVAVQGEVARREGVADGRVGK